MDKNAIKKFAVWARRELISRVGQRAALYEITADGYGDPDAASVLGRVLSAEERKQRSALITRIREKGYEQVMEEIAYTWFNRFIALRFMEVNGYLPSRIRVFTDDSGAFKPQILAEAIDLDLDGLDMEKVYTLKSANDNEALYKYLLITQCNALSPILPGMFQKIADYTELLFPDNLLRDGSVVEQMIAMIPEEDWTDQVQIIGWLYQYYNSEKKDDVFAALKKNVKITKENIPAATQLFTPDWIVRYMVENSLGRLWVEGHPNDELKATWKYYLEEAEQETEVQAQLAEIRKEYAAMNPEDIKVIDPCCGSGHILCYLFDVLMQIYESQGYTPRDAVQGILQNNLNGLDIDKRAAQLAYFSVMMKARQYDKRVFSRGITPQVYCPDGYPDGELYGSLITVDKLEPEPEQETWTLLDGDYETAHNTWNFRHLLAQKYDVVVTNPPYMGSGNMDAKLGEHVKKNYPDSKADTFACFIERCGQMAGKNGYQAMITQHAWMFLSSFEKLRQKLQAVDTVNMAHLGPRAFEEIGGEVVQTTTFVLRQSHVKDYAGTYCRLIEPTTQQGKEDMFLAGENRHTAKQSNFSMIPGCPIAYWVSLKSIELFESRPKLSDFFIGRVGLMTTDNDRFLRFFWEVELSHICFSAQDQTTCSLSGKKYFPHNKGGSFRKWAGNRDYVVDWENNGERIKRTAIEKYPYLNGNPNFVVHDDGYYFRENVSWSEIAMSNLAFRYYPSGFTFNVKGMSAFPQGEYNLYDLLAFCNSVVCSYFARVINPSISFGVNSFANIPFIAPPSIAREVALQNITLSCADWDAFETSWDFQRHPLIRSVPTVAEAYGQWERECDERFYQLKANEEELNRIFIDIYGLQDELTPEVEDKDVTVRKADLTRDIKSLISYAVGCMFGRYSLDYHGLILAGQPYESRFIYDPSIQQEYPPKYFDGHFLKIVEDSEYVMPCTFVPDRDNILPICDDEYFEDDIVGRFVKFVEVVYGKETLEENLRFIADALGGKGSPREVIRNYFLNDFYADHLKVYQKRPIYWQFDSGKKNGFKCLIYMHRYAPDTIARIRTDYVHEQQSRYRTAIADLESRIANAGTSERVKLTKQLTKLQAQAEELRVYEEKIHHLADQMISIDLDDGVKVNYAKFQDVLAKIK